MKRIIIGAVILGGMWIYTNGGNMLSGNTDDGVVNFADDDAQMNAAMDDARASLPAFLANVVDGDGDNIGNTSIKVAFPIGNNNNEIIWVGPFSWDGNDQMNGLLSNQPVQMGDLNAGDPVEFTTDMVRDWSLVTEDGIMWGNYTTRVIVPQLDADMAAQLNAVLSPDPVPADW